jgi:transcriptional regulator with XRE-family HTH domain
MDISGQIKKIRKGEGFLQQEMDDKLSIKRVQFNQIEISKINSTTNVIILITTYLEMKVVGFFEDKKEGTEIRAINKPFL